MTDSEEDIPGPNNIYTFQNDSTIFRAKGPNLSINNKTMGFRQKCHTSAYNMPRNFEKRKAESVSDLKSSYYRRETSPMSLRTDFNLPPRNFQYSFYNSAASQRDYGGRGGSPMSVRSIGSNMSVSAKEIAQAFKTEHFNKQDLRIIKEAYNKFMKSRLRKRIEKRRNLRLFLKGHRHKSGYDGENSSNSSFSSDDCKSTRTGITLYRSSRRDDNKSSCDSRSTRTDLIDLRKTMIESEMYRDCSDSFRQSNFRNMFGTAGTSSVNLTQLKAPDNFSEAKAKKTVPQASVKSLKDRFINVNKSGFLLPSQRFNKSTVTLPTLEEHDKFSNNENSNSNNSKNFASYDKENSDHDMDIDQEAIFSNKPKSGRPQKKRSIDSVDCNADNNSKKRSKILSPIKPDKVVLLNNLSFEKSKGNLNKSKSDFQFAKPFPIRKLAPRPKEKVIAKSALPLLDTFEHVDKQVHNNKTMDNQILPELTLEEEPSQVTQNYTTDVSMRPSFIKRKLFTQTLDMTERKNTSSDSVSTASPQGNVYSNITKEKNKTRKLVNNQLCLNRDIQEDNNLLDLIHKIVPLQQINSTCITTANNKSEQLKHNENKKSLNQNPDDDKWDITSILTTCDNSDLSDTFTDEEIFEKTDSTIKNSNKRKKTQITNERLKTSQPTFNVNKSASEIVSKKIIGKSKKLNDNDKAKNKITVEPNKVDEVQDYLKLIEKPNNNRSNEIKTQTMPTKINQINDNNPIIKPSMNNNRKCINKAKDNNIVTSNTAVNNNQIKKVSPDIAKLGRLNDSLKNYEKPANNKMLTNFNLKKCQVFIKPVNVSPRVKNPSFTADSGASKKNIQSYVESFWNTDVESDMECSGNISAHKINGYKSSCVSQKNQTEIQTELKTSKIDMNPSSKKIRKNTTEGKKTIKVDKSSKSEMVNPESTTSEDNKLPDNKIITTVKHPRIRLGDLSSSIQSENNSSVNSTWDGPPKSIANKSIRKRVLTSRATNCCEQDKKQVPVKNDKNKGKKKSPINKGPTKQLNESKIEKTTKHKYNTKKVDISDTNNNLSSNDSFCKSLRTRDIYVSICLDKDKEEKNKTIGKETIAKSKKSKKSNDNSKLSDLSFSINTPQNEKRAGQRNKTLVINNNGPTKNSRLSDLSFTLRSGKKTPINRSITRSKRLSAKISRRL